MYDIRCPYCGNGQDIDHDDGYGYREDRIYEQECSKCDRTFAYTTSIIYSYDVFKAPCLTYDHNTDSWKPKE